MLEYLNFVSGYVVEFPQILYNVVCIASKAKESLFIGAFHFYPKFSVRNIKEIELVFTNPFSAKVRLFLFVL